MFCLQGCFGLSSASSNEAAPRTLAICSKPWPDNFSLCYARSPQGNSRVVAVDDVMLKTVAAHQLLHRRDAERLAQVGSMIVR